METDGSGACGLHDPYDRGDAGIRRGRVCIWSSASWNLHLRCRGDSVRNGDPPVYDGNLFSVWTDGSVPRIHAGNGIFAGANDYLCDRYGRTSDCMDWMDIPGASFSGCTVYLLSGILDSDDYHAGDLFLLVRRRVHRKVV